MALKKHQRINWEELKESYSRMAYVKTCEENEELEKTVKYLENRVSELENAIRVVCKVTHQKPPCTRRTLLIDGIYDDCPVIWL